MHACMYGVRWPTRRGRRNTRLWGRPSRGSLPSSVLLALLVMHRLLSALLASVLTPPPPAASPPPPTSSPPPPPAPPALPPTLAQPLLLFAATLACILVAHAPIGSAACAHLARRRQPEFVVHVRTAAINLQLSFLRSSFLSPVVTVRRFLFCVPVTCCLATAAAIARRCPASCRRAAVACLRPAAAALAAGFASDCPADDAADAAA